MICKSGIYPQHKQPSYSERKTMKGLAFTKDNNQIATPWHIVEFLSDLLEVDNKTVLDPTAGAGAMLKRAGRPLGIEFDSKAFGMLRAEVPNGDLINASVFDCLEWIQERKPEVVMMNPPFNCPKTEMPEEYRKKYGTKGMDSTKGLYFVRWVADAVGRGRLVAIVPTGAIGGGNKALKETTSELLKRHSLEAVLKLNSDLFYPSVSVHAVALVLRMGEPHSGKTWFADFSDAGLEKDRTKGRIDKNGKWAETKKRWLDLFERKPDDEEAGYGTVETTVEQDWNMLWPRPEVNLMPTEDDFKKTVRDYLLWKIQQVMDSKIDMEEILTPETPKTPEERLELLRQKQNALSLEILELEKEIENAGKTE